MCESDLQPCWSPRNKHTDLPRQRTWRQQVHGAQDAYLHFIASESRQEAARWWHERHFGFSPDSPVAEEACTVLAHPETGVVSLPCRGSWPLALKHQGESMVAGNRQISSYLRCHEHPRILLLAPWMLPEHLILLSHRDPSSTREITGLWLHPHPVCGQGTDHPKRASVRCLGTQMCLKPPPQDCVVGCGAGLVLHLPLLWPLGLPSPSTLGCLPTVP